MASRWRSLAQPGQTLLAYRPISAPRCACVYAVYLDSVLVYVGSTSNLYSRITRHVISQSFDDHRFTTPWGTGGLLVIKFKRSKRFGDWAMDELRLIRRLKPRGNRAVLRGAR